MTVWAIMAWEEIQVVCTTEERAKRWVVEEVEKREAARRKHNEEADLIRAEYDALPGDERVRIGFGNERTVNEMVKYGFRMRHDDYAATPESYTISEWTLLE